MGEVADLAARRASTRPSKRVSRPRPLWDVLELHWMAGASYRDLAALPEAKGYTHTAIASHSKLKGWSRDDGTLARAKARAEIAKLEMGLDLLAEESTPAGETPPKRTPLVTPAMTPLDHTVAKMAHVGVRQRSRLEAAVRHIEALDAAIHTLINARMDDDEYIVAATKFLTPRQSVSDLILLRNRLVGMLQDKERVAFDMDQRDDDKVQPFIPQIARRGAPLASKVVNRPGDE